MEKLKITNLEYATPEEVGIDSTAIKNFIDEINEKKLGLQSFTIVRHNKICAQGFWKPYAKDFAHVMYSMSKSVTSTAVGFAVSEGLISLNDKVSSFFPEYPSAKLSWNKDLTIENLLTMRSDKLITFIEEKNHTDWIKKYFDAPFMSKPNTKFNYVSENTFMLSAIITKVTGMSMVDYLYPRMFEPLGIEKPFWEADGRGNNSAGWGLYMKSGDIAKFFLPYLNDGKWIDGTQIIPKEWVVEATAKHTGTVKDGYPDYMAGYGYQFWRNPVENSFRCDGLFGQRCLMFKDYDALVVLNSGESEDYKIMEVFWKYFPECFKKDALPNNDKAYVDLLDTISKCQVEDLMVKPRNTKLEKKINNRLIKCKTNAFTSVISISVLNMLYNKPGKISDFKFNFKENSADFTWTEKGEENTIELGLDGEYRESKMHLKDLNYHAFSKASWQEDGSLEVWIRPIETAHVRKFNFKFNEDNSVKIINKMNPTFQELTLYYMTFMGTPIKSYKGRSFVQNAVKTFGLPILEPNIKGHLE